MPVGTYKQYIERLKKMKNNVYIDGKKPNRGEDFNSGGVFAMKQTFDFAADPEYEDLCTATSHLTGEKINRFTHIHRSQDDIFKKQQMTRLLR